MIYLRLKKLREDNNITQSEMASYLHVAQRTYSRYERGEHEMPISLLMKTADKFNTSVDYIVERTDIRRPYRYRDEYLKSNSLVRDEKRRGKGQK